MGFVDKVSKCLNKIKNGHNEEFETLYQMTFYHLLGIAKLYLKNKSNAEDVVIDAYTKIYLYINTYKDGENGYNWMCKIVQNAAFYQNNIDKRNEELFNSLAASFDEIDTRSIGLDTKLDVLDTIEKLDEDSKSLIYAYFYYGKKLKEIADENNISSPAAKKRINKVLKKLKKYFK